MNVLICGGAKSGKTMLAQRLCRTLAREQGGRLVYLATLEPWDREDQRRVQRHRQERAGWGFVTLEEPRDLGQAPVQAGDVVLVDSLTAILGNLLFLGPCPPDPAAFLLEGLAALWRRAGAVVAVSDDIFSDAALYTGDTEQFRLLLGQLHQGAAKGCDTLVECVAGLPLVHKGRLPQEERGWSR